MSRTDLSRYARLDAFLTSLAKDVYPEPPSQLHSDITRKMIAHLVGTYPDLGGRVLDVGCGQGLALEVLRDAGMAPVGITLGDDYRVCKEKGYDVHEMDQSFLDFPDGSFDAVWCRHALEHSIFPHFTLSGFNRVLRPGGFLYVEVPAPDTACLHHTNPNHYSVMGRSMWVDLVRRNGFVVLDALDIDFETGAGPDVYYAIIARKLR